MPKTMHESWEALHKTPRTPLRLQIAGQYAAPEGKDFPFHRDRTWEVIYYRSGAIDSVVGGEHHPGLPGVVLAIPPRLLHGELAKTAYVNYFIQIDAPEDQPWPRICYDDEHGSIGNVCGAIVREWLGGATERSRMIGLLIDQLDVTLRRALEQTHLPEGERIVREAERLIGERFRGQVMIADVAREIGVSPSGLRALFGRHRAGTPMAYLQAIRVQHALGIIRNSNLSLETVAHACGYDSASHLSRHVKRVTGQSPGALRGRG